MSVPELLLLTGSHGICLAADPAGPDASHPFLAGGFETRTELLDGFGEARWMVGQPQQIIDDQDLSVAAGPRPDADHWDTGRLHDRIGDFLGDRFDEQQDRPCMLQGDRILHHLMQGLSRASGRDRPAGHRAGLWAAADVGTDRHTSAGQPVDQRGEGLIAFELDDIGPALRHKSCGVVHRTFEGGVVAHKGHVGHDERLGRTAFDGCSQFNGKIDGHVDRSIMSEHHLSRRVPGKQYMDACSLEPAGGGGVVGRKTGEGFTLPFHAVECLEGHRFGHTGLGSRRLVRVWGRCAHERSIRNSRSQASRVVEICHRMHTTVVSGYALVSEPQMSSTSTLKPTPRLTDDQILRVVCGLRPCRHGGLRIETQTIGDKLIVHQYGHGGCGVTISFGTAEIACKLLESNSSRTEPVAVLGAGVVGLVTARMLAKRGQSVTIYADRVAHETTSVLAGALWLPVGVEFGTGHSAEDRKDRILRDSIHAFRTLDPARYAVEELGIYEPAGSHTEEGLFAPGLIEEPEPIIEFPFHCAAQPGRMFRTLFIHTPRFLEALLEDLRDLGVSIIPRRFDTLGALKSVKESVVINCMAMGSGMLFEDPAVYPARGVLVHMKPQDLGYCVHDGYKYMFPRSDALVLGGCFQPDRDDVTPDDEMVREILDHHRRFFGSACGVG